MKINFIFPILAIALLLITTGCGQQEPQADEITEYISKVEKNLTGPVYLKGEPTWTIEERMAHYDVPGVSLAVIKDNRVHWTKNYGVVNKDSGKPVTDRTLFQAASISKPVSAMAALKMVELGQLSLDRDINSHLTSWQLPENEFTEKDKVNLRHLLSHTGGLTVHGFLGYSPGLEVPTLVQLLDGTAPANSSEIRVDKKPGESFRYSGGGYCIAQQAMIDAAGKSFPELMDELVLTPLDMGLSTFEQPLPEDRLGEAATGYLPDGTMTTGERHTYPEMAAAGLWTNAAELARFAIELQLSHQGKSNKILSQEMTTDMLTPYVSDHTGLGIGRMDREGEAYFQHGGWNEGFSSMLMAHRDKGYGVVVMINTNKPEFIDELVRSVALSYNWDNYLPVYEAQEIPETAGEHVGRYRMGPDRVARVFQENDRLFFHMMLDEPVEVFYIGDQQYISREFAEIARFKQKEESGRYFLDISGPWNKKDFAFDHPKMKEDDKVPSEWLLDGDSEKALEAYQALKAENPEAEAIREGRLNNMGYQLLRTDQIDLAIEVFRVNTRLYPDAFNTYDSLGEAYMKKGEYELAISNYQKSLDLNPENANAVEMLKKLEVETL